MKILTTNADSPPPLTLMLNVLEHLQTAGGTPLATGWGNTYGTNLSSLTQELAHLEAPKLITLLTLAGQMLLRYLPLFLEADSMHIGAYTNKYGISTGLPGGNSYRKLLPLIPIAARVKRLSEHIAARQRLTSGIIPRWVGRLKQPDPRVLGAYTVMRPRGNYIASKSMAVSANRLMVARDRAAVHPSVDVMPLGNRWPGLIGPPATPDEPADSSSGYRIPHTSTVGAGPSLEVTPISLLTILASRAHPRLNIQRDTCYDSANMFFKPDSLPQGMFFKTPLVTASLEPMGEGDFGMVDVSEQPFKITLNSDMAYPRVQLSFIHELLHVLCEQAKINLSHEDVHSIAVMTINNVLPGLAELAAFTHNNK